MGLYHLYYIICFYYFSSLSSPLKYETKKYVLKVDDYTFIGLSSRIIDNGFLDFQPLKMKEYVSEFAPLKKKQKYRIINYGIEEKETVPPDYLTEAELVEEMEKNNIGTDGSIPNHIKNLELRGYIKIDEKRRLIPTKLGITLIDALNKIEPEIVRPENRAKIEEFVKKIEIGEKNYKEVLDNAIKFYESKFINCCSKLDELREEFKKKFKLKEIYSRARRRKELQNSRGRNRGIWNPKRRGIQRRSWRAGGIKGRRSDSKGKGES